MLVRLGWDVRHGLGRKGREGMQQREGGEDGGHGMCCMEWDELS